MDFFFSKKVLLKAWSEIYREKPKSKRKYSKGIDGISIEDFKQKETQYLEELYRQIEGGIFEFLPLHEYQIPRKGKSPRTIHAPTVRDRIVQKVLSEYLNRQFAKRFKDVGVVGSLPDTRIREVLKEAVKTYKDGLVFVLKTDIKNYFPSIDRDLLSKKFYSAVHDKELRAYFNKYIDQAKQLKEGIPQGTPLSPFFANLYLYDFDIELAKYRFIKHFRYIDDLIVFSRTPEEAVEAFNRAKEVFKNLKLTVYELPTPDKTMLEEWSNGKIPVLGVVYYEGELYIKREKVKEFQTFVLNDIRASRKKKTHRIVFDVNNYLNYLNSQIQGWSAAYAFCNVEKLYRNLDAKIELEFNKLLIAKGVKSADRERYLKKLVKCISAWKKLHKGR